MALDGSKLKVSIQEGARWRRTLQITVPSEQVKAEQTRLVRELSGRVRLPGFRSGKVPQQVLERRFGGAVQREMLDRLIGDAYKEVLARESLRPISEGEVDDIQFQPEQDLVFSISFDVSPTVEISRLGGFQVERPVIALGDDEVDRVIDRIRDENGSWEPADEGHPMVGDLVSVAITNLSTEGTEPREYDLVLGGGDAIPEVEDAIRTLQPGGEGEFVVHFPDDFPDEARRGEEQQLRIALRARKSRVLPELSDEFAARVGPFQSVAELRERVRADLEKEAADQSEGAVRGQLLDRILDANPFEVPDSMVTQYLRSILGQEKPDEAQMERARAAMGPQAERAVKRILVIERVAEIQGLRATDDELDARIEAIAEASQSSPAEVYARFQKSGRLEMLERELTEEKVFDFLKGQSQITDAA